MLRLVEWALSLHPADVRAGFYEEMRAVLLERMASANSRPWTAWFRMVAWELTGLIWGAAEEHCRRPRLRWRKVDLHTSLQRTARSQNLGGHAEARKTGWTPRTGSAWTGSDVWY